METVHILHTNDLHSHLENWPMIARFLNDRRTIYQTAGQTVLTFDIGDFIDRVHPLTEATLGLANIELRNQVAYDAVTIGNNEGLGLSHEAMTQLAQASDAPVLLANMLDMTTDKRPSWAQPYQIFTTKTGVRIGVIGLTAPYILTYPPLGWMPLDAVATLKDVLPQVRAQSDVVVLLSHLGYPVDVVIGEELAIDVVIGAHSHHVLPEGEWHNGTLLAAAGRFGDHVGEITLTLDDGKIQAAQAVAHPTYTLDTANADLAQAHAWLVAGEKTLQQQVITTLPRRQTAEDQAFFALQAMQKLTGAPAAFVATGMFVEDLPAGPLTAARLLESMPHAVHPVKVTLSGADLRAFVGLTQEWAEYLATYPMRGMGFRGKLFGQMRWRGMSFGHQGEIYYAGVLLDDTKTYELALLDHYIWIKYFPLLQKQQLDIHMETLLRELMADYYRSYYG